MRQGLRLKLTMLALEALREIAYVIARWGRVPDDEPIVVSRYQYQHPELRKWLGPKEPTEWN